MNATPVILYVEDNPQSREIMDVLVRQVMGLPWLTMFEDSEDFSNRIMALNPRPDIVLLDIHVPPNNGFQMLKILRALPGFSRVPVIALTASVMNEEVEQLRNAGFDGVVAKPVDIDHFPAILNHVLNGKSIWNLVN